MRSCRSAVAPEELFEAQRQHLKKRRRLTFVFRYSRALGRCNVEVGKGAKKLSASVEARCGSPRTSQSVQKVPFVFFPSVFGSSLVVLRWIVPSHPTENSYSTSYFRSSAVNYVRGRCAVEPASAA